MKKGLFLTEARHPGRHLAIFQSNWRVRFHLRSLVVDAKGLHQILEESSCNVSDSVESRRLELFETSVVENLANTALQSCTTDIGCHGRALF